MTLHSFRRPSPLSRFALLLFLSLLTVVPLAGCGSSTTTASGGTASQSVQVMATVTRGDIVDTVMARVQLTITKGSAKGVAKVAAASAGNVAKGQAVELTFGGQRAGQAPSGAARSGSPYPMPSGTSMPVPGGSPGASGFGQGFGGKAAKGVVSSVKTNSDGSATVTIAIAKLPSGVTAKSVGLAQIAAKVLAKNVLVLPAVAIKGSGGNATVQVVVNGKTTTRKIVVGKQTQMLSEIVSGLSEGDNVVYTRTFRGRFPGAGGNGYQGQGGQQGMPQGMPQGAPSGMPPGGAPGT